jgi:hypothetical protein
MLCAFTTPLRTPGHDEKQNVDPARTGEGHLMLTMGLAYLAALGLLLLGTYEVAARRIRRH